MIALLACSRYYASAVTQQQEDAAIQALEELFSDNGPPPQHYMSLIPRAVRFGFNFCSEHGCSGCLDLDNKSNRGLEDIYVKLNKIYDEVLPSLVPENDVIMSRGDLWAMCSLVAARKTIPADYSQLRELVRFVYGREDCATSPKPDYEPVEHGDHEKGFDEIMRVLGPESIFGFDMREIATLVGGGHSLGRVKYEHSMYRGSTRNCRTREYVMSNFSKKFLSWL